MHIVDRIKLKMRYLKYEKYNIVNHCITNYWNASSKIFRVALKEQVINFNLKKNNFQFLIKNLYFSIDY